MITGRVVQSEESPRGDSDQQRGARSPNLDSAEKQMIDTLLSVNLLIQRPIRQVGGTAESTQQPVIILIANTHGPYLCRVLWAGCVFSVHGACLFNVHTWECTWAGMHMERVYACVYRPKICIECLH